MQMSADSYLQGILVRTSVDTGLYSPVRGVQRTLAPLLNNWAGQYLLSVAPSGSFAKGTANSTGTDIDLFISLSQSTPDALKEVHATLVRALRSAGYTPRLQNVSINIKVGGYDVDLVPGKRQNAYSTDHSLYRRKADTWTKTNVDTHAATVIGGRRQLESRIIKLWRDQKGLSFPSFYIELCVIEALRGRTGSLSSNVWRVLEYLRDSFTSARIVDPANTANIISDDLTVAEKVSIQRAAAAACAASNWAQIVV